MSSRQKPKKMQLIPLPQKTKYIPAGENAGLIEIIGCYPGYGTTLGNALRRVLLSSLDGSAITAVKIKGVNHEFSAIPDVLEDVIQIVLNLKQIRFKLFDVEKTAATLRVKGEKKINAGMIECSSNLEVVNKNAHIATITKSSGELEMEFTIEKGIGYVPVEQQNRTDKEVGVIALDAIYTPIKKVNYSISNTRVGKRTDFEKISLEILTDGSLSPIEAFSKAVGVLVKQFSTMEKIGEEDEEQEKNDILEANEKEEKETIVKNEKEKAEKEAKEEEKEKPKPKEKEIVELKNLSTRTLNVLEKSEVKTVGDIAKLTEEELSSLEGMGAKGIKEIKKAIGDFGINLKKEK